MIYCISYPRSGSNLLLYILEKLGLPCKNPLYKQKDDNINGIIKKHSVNDVIYDSTTKFIFLVRDYKECVLSHHKILASKNATYEELLVEFIPEIEPRLYIDVIKFMHRIRNKTIVYYEDLINDTPKVVKRVCEYLNLEYNDIDYDKIKQEIRGIYTNNLISRGKDYTQSDSFTYHQDKLTDIQKNNVDRYVEIQYPLLFKNYLERYK